MDYPDFVSPLPKGSPVIRRPVDAGSYPNGYDHVTVQQPMRTPKEGRGKSTSSNTPKAECGYPDHASLTNDSCIGFGKCSELAERNALLEAEKEDAFKRYQPNSEQGPLIESNNYISNRGDFEQGLPDSYKRPVRLSFWEWQVRHPEQAFIGANKWRDIGYFLGKYPGYKPWLGRFPTDYQHYLRYKTAARYGMATGGLLPSGCSSWLMGGPFLGTAAHCRRITGEEEARIPGSRDCIGRFESLEDFMDLKKRSHSLPIPNNLQTVTFGQFTDPSLLNKDELPESVIEKLGREHARERMLDLGVPEYNYAKGGIDYKKYWEDDGVELAQVFDCDLAETAKRRAPGSMPCRDIDYYKCRPNEIKFVLNVRHNNHIPFEDREKVNFLPSHIWGHVPLWNLNQMRHRRRLLPVGDDIYFLQSNRARKYHSYRQNLLSDGIMAGMSGKEFFGHDMYWEGGSSGGIFVDFATNRGFGALSSFSFNPFLWYNGKNAAAALGNFIGAEALGMLQQYEKDSLVFDRRVFTGQRQNLQKSPRVGVMKGRSVSDAFCPNGFMAAGVMGLKTPNTGQLGNFGLVCLPFSMDYQFEKALVVSEGSRYIGRRKADKIPLDITLNEEVIRSPSTGFELYQQSFQMCPPRYFMRGISLGEGGELVSFGTGRLGANYGFSGISALHCENVAGNRNIDIQPRTGLGKLGVKSNNDLFAQLPKTLMCPKGFYISGFDSFVDPYTGATSFIRIRCQDVHQEWVPDGNPKQWKPDDSYDVMRGLKK